MEKQTLFDSVISMNNLYNAWNTIKEKKSSGGVDDVSVDSYSKSLSKRLSQLHHLLETEKWLPSPYYNIEIQKVSSEVRVISLTVVEDKIVQTAIKQVIEPILEHSFLSCSYAYRPGRGHLKCIRRTLAEMRNRDNSCFIQADVDNYFDSIDRSRLLRRLATPIPDRKLLNLIGLCISMGGVSPDLAWHESAKGIPQGATLSPLLANFYLSPFDQSVTSHCQSYVRYSDNFIIWCRGRGEASRISKQVTEFLSSRLELRLNDVPEPREIEEGVEFLGLFIKSSGISLTQKKIQELSDIIGSIKLSNGQLDSKYIKTLEGIRRYYIKALPASYQETFIEILVKTVTSWEESGRELSRKNVEEIYQRLLGKPHQITDPGRGRKNKRTWRKRSSNERTNTNVWRQRIQNW